LLARALDRIAALTDEVPDAVRIAAARAIAGPAVPPALLACFVDRPETAAPLLAAAQLDEAEWRKLRDKAAPAVQELMDTLRSEPPAPPSAAADRPQPLAAAPPAPPPDPPGLFRWECGPTGEIDWVEGAPRAALIGRSLADDFSHRFAARLPFSDEPLVLAKEGELAGQWRWSGTPTFFPDTGRFAGYRGSAQRGQVGAPEPAGEQEVGTAFQGDNLRELIHELRTPLNAIIGFGEIIEGQILGPAHRAYRDRAAEIVRQARRLLAAVDDLDLAAKLQSGRARAGEGSAIAELLTALARQLEPALAGKGVRLQLPASGAGFRSALREDLAGRLLRRFVEGVLGAAEAGETLTLQLERRGGLIALSIGRPRALQRTPEQRLLDPSFSLEGESGLGTGFALRLVRGLAIVAGGALEVGPDRLSLLLRPD
jgi:hypothetical protein